MLFSSSQALAFAVLLGRPTQSVQIGESIFFGAGWLLAEGTAFSRADRRRKSWRGSSNGECVVGRWAKDDDSLATHERAFGCARNGTKSILVHYMCREHMGDQDERIHHRELHCQPSGGIQDCALGRPCVSELQFAWFRLENRLVRPAAGLAVNDRVVQRRPRLGGMLNHYYRAAA